MVELEKKVAELPRRPGVYLFKDEQGKVLYVGKATDLRSRVSSYLRPGGDGRPMIPFLEGRMKDLETVICDDPAQALLLEDSLIKKFKPPYNVRLKDDKNYLLVRIDLAAEYPRLQAARRRRDDGALYFGPFPSAQRVRALITVLRKVLGLRDCKDRDFASRSRPCIRFDMGHCTAPCAGRIEQQAYRDRVQEGVEVLKGGGKTILKKLRLDMADAATELNYERAQVIKDRLEALEAVCGTGPITLGKGQSCDAFHLLRNGNEVDAVVLNFREGRLAGNENFTIETGLPDAELLSTVITRYYRGGRYVSDSLLVPFLPNDAEAIALWLGRRRGRKVVVQQPQRGEKARLLELAATNAQQAQAQRLGRDETIRLALNRLTERLGLAGPPQVIHCFDVSHTQGSEITASRTALRAGELAPDLYRRFRVRGLAGQDDYAALSQVVVRSLRDADKKGETRPDLVILDGGRGQVRVVEAALEREGFGPIPLAGIAKARPPRSAGKHTRARAAVPERLVPPGGAQEFTLAEEEPETRLLARLRDEAHRFAITYHRKLRGKTGSTLERIPGVGVSRRNLLLRRFGSLKGIKAAGLEQLKQVAGVPEKVAEDVYHWLRKSRLSGK